MGKPPQSDRWTQALRGVHEQWILVGLGFLACADYLVVGSGLFSSSINGLTWASSVENGSFAWLLFINGAAISSSELCYECPLDSQNHIKSDLNHFLNQMEQWILRN